MDIGTWKRKDQDIIWHGIDKLRSLGHFATTSQATNNLNLIFTDTMQTVSHGIVVANNAINKALEWISSDAESNHTGIMRL